MANSAVPYCAVEVALLLAMGAITGSNGNTQVMPLDSASACTFQSLTRTCNWSQSAQCLVPTIFI